MTTNRNYQEVANENEMLQILGIKKETLRRLRKKGLPCVELTKTDRVYIATDVLNWCQNKTRNNYDEEC